MIQARHIRLLKGKRLLLPLQVQRTSVYETRRKYCVLKTVQLISYTFNTYRGQCLFSTKFTKNNLTETKYVEKSTECQTDGVPKRVQLMLERWDNKVQYVETENDHFHQILEKHPSFSHYMMFQVDYTGSDVLSQDGQSSTVLLLDKDLDDARDMLETLARLSQLPQEKRNGLVENAKFKSLCHSILHQIIQLSDPELFYFMKILTQFGLRDALAGEKRLFRLALFHTISDECVRRFDNGSYNWNLDKLFLCADFCYALRTSSYFTSTIMERFRNEVEKHVSTLAPSDLVLFMFHSSASRKLSSAIIEQLLEKILFHFKDFNFEEVALVCLGLFKTNTQIYSPQLLVAITNSLNNNFNNGSSMALSAVFKALIKSTNKNTSKRVPNFGDTLGPLLDKSTLLIPDLPFSTTIHIFRFFLTNHYISEAFLEKLVDMVLRSDLSKWRVKEISRFIFNFSNLMCYSSKKNFHQVLTKLLEELKNDNRGNELQLFPECLVQSLVGLSVADIYDKQLIDLLFTEDFIELLSSNRKSLKDVDFRRDLFQLYHSIKIDRPDYCKDIPFPKFNWASIKQLRLGGRGQSKRTDLRAVRDLIMEDVKAEMCHILGGQQYFKESQLLDHFQTSDFEFRLNASDEPILVTHWSNSCKTTPRGDPEVIGEKNRLQSLLLQLANKNPKEKSVCVAVFGPNCYHMYRDQAGFSSKQLLGLHQMKIRHLTSSGYYVIQVPYFEFNQAKDKTSYMKRKLLTLK